jgi:predicted TIM-barrel fold metal-dependent hydrolase
MLSRRRVLIGAAVAGIARLARAAEFDMPAGACDCHVHIFGDARQFPFVPTRVYTPGPASIDELRALHRRLHISRVVIIQPSVYGTDNACTLDAIRRIGPTARGVAVIDAATPDTALDEMNRAGIRGLRVNIATGGQADPAVSRQRLKLAVERAHGRDWHVQVNTGLPFIERIQDDVMAAPVPFVFDHFGGAEAARGIDQPGFGALLKLVRAGKAYVKLSGAYRSSASGPPYLDVLPLAKALIAANPQRMLWGTDWPHPDSSLVPGRKPTDIAPRLPIDDRRILDQLAVWAPDPALRATILVENPARLYSF